MEIPGKPVCQAGHAYSMTKIITEKYIVEQKYNRAYRRALDCTSFRLDMTGKVVINFHSL